MEPSAIRQVSLFNGLGTRQVEAISAGARRKRHRQGSTVVAEGDAGHSLYIVLSGRVAICKTNALGESVHLAERGQGGHFGEMSLLDGKPRAADVVALEDSDFLVIDRSEFLRAIRSDPDLAIRILVTLCDRLRQADDQTSQILTVRERLAMKLLSLAKEGGRSHGTVKFRLGITRQALADQVRARRETVSREMSNLEAQGLIRSSGREIVVPDMSNLARFAGKETLLATQPSV
ncbi:MAG: Crp/Fnr family transcriptional regulator [Armatimonadetes bacterium]|nr:Crp/Fnr family transcriptional regulator [Armatimonadota bacterium]